MAMTDITDAHFGRALKILLDDAGMSQGDLADHLGVTQSAISERVTGRVSIKASEFSRIAALLGKDPIDLLLLARQLAGYPELPTAEAFSGLKGQVEQLAAQLGSLSAEVYGSKIERAAEAAEKREKEGGAKRRRSAR